MKFDDLVSRLNPKIMAIAHKLDGKYRVLDHEDLYQEALLYLWQKWKRNELQDKTDSFVLQGCYFHLKNYLRKMCKEVNFILFDVQNLPEQEEPKDYSELIRKELLYYDIFDKLKKRERVVLELSLKNYTVREIGKILGISHVMVIKIKKRIKGKLMPISFK